MEELGDLDISVVRGDALNEEDVIRAMEGQDILVGSVEGDVLAMAKNIVNTLGKTSVKRIIWISGMGIHGEVKGAAGLMYKTLAKTRPTYIEATDLIAASPAIITVLRCPAINKGGDTSYDLTTEDEQPRCQNVDVVAIGQCVADLIEHEDRGVNESLGITN